MLVEQILARTKFINCQLVCGLIAKLGTPLMFISTLTCLMMFHFNSTYMNCSMKACLCPTTLNTLISWSHAVLYSIGQVLAVFTWIHFDNVVSTKLLSFIKSPLINI